MIHGTGAAIEVFLTTPLAINAGVAVEVFGTLVWDDCGGGGFLVSISIGPKAGVGANTGLGGQVHVQYLLGLGVDCVQDINTVISPSVSIDGHLGLGLGLDLDLSQGPKGRQLLIRVGGGLGTATNLTAKGAAGVYHKFFPITSPKCPCPPAPWWMRVGAWVPFVGWIFPVLNRDLDD